MEDPKVDISWPHQSEWNNGQPHVDAYIRNSQGQIVDQFHHLTDPWSLQTGTSEMLRLIAVGMIGLAKQGE